MVFMSFFMEVMTLIPLTFYALLCEIMILAVRNLTECVDSLRVSIMPKIPLQELIQQHHPTTISRIKCLHMRYTRIQKVVSYIGDMFAPYCLLSYLTIACALTLIVYSMLKTAGSECAMLMLC